MLDGWVEGRIDYFGSLLRVEGHLLWERKFVSTSTEYGGTSAWLYWKKRDDETWGLREISGIR